MVRATLKSYEARGSHTMLASEVLRKCGSYGSMPAEAMVGVYFPKRGQAHLRPFGLL